jgi:N-methylhydantoinase A
VLGYLNPKGCSEGRLPLDLEKARRAIKKIADPLGLSIEQAAYGMFTIVNNNMVNGIRRVSVERGYDPARFRAGWRRRRDRRAHHLSRREIGIDTIVLPKLASGLCAFGQIISDVKYNYMATSPRASNGFGLRQRSTGCSKDRSQGRETSCSPTALPAARSDRAQPRHALRRAGARMHRRDRNFRDRCPGDRSQVKGVSIKRHEELYTYSERAHVRRSRQHRSDPLRHVDKPRPPRVKKGALPRRRSSVVARRSSPRTEALVEHPGLRRRYHRARRRRRWSAIEGSPRSSRNRQTTTIA